MKILIILFFTLVLNASIMDDINDILVIMTFTYPWQVKNVKEVIFSKWVRDVIYIPPPNREDKRKLLSMFFKEKGIICEKSDIYSFADDLIDATPFELRKASEAISAYLHLYNTYEKVIKYPYIDADVLLGVVEGFIGNLPMSYKIWKQELLKAKKSSAINFLKEIVLNVEKNIK